MKMKINLILILMIIICSSARKFKSSIKDSTKLPNSDFMFKGYNIYTADPTPNKGNIDPGFEALVFETSYTDNVLSSDHRFQIPNGYQFQRVEGCDVAMTSTEITGESSFKNTFGIDIGVSGTVKGVTFSASASFQNIAEETSKNKKAWVYSRSDCKVYTGEMDTYNPPKLHRSFLSALKSLQKNTFDVKPEAYWKFIKTFGTHFVYDMKMGARFGAMSKISQTELSKMMSNKVSFSRSIGIKDIISLTNNISNENVTTSKATSSFEDIKVFTIGSLPPEDYKASTWASKAQLEPMPIAYDVLPIIEIFSNENIEFDLDQFSGIDINLVKTNLKLALDNYCEKYLIPNNRVRSCTNIGADAVLEKQKIPANIGSGGAYYLINAQTKNCLHAPNVNNNGENAVTYQCRKDLISQQAFKFSLSNSLWYMKVGNNNCLDLTHAPSHDNANLHLRRCDTHRNMTFTLKKNDDLSYTIMTVRGKCLEVQYDNTADHSPVVQMTCNNSPGQRWIPRPTHDI